MLKSEKSELVVDPVDPLARATAKRFRVRCYNTPSQMIGKESLDGVVISKLLVRETPTPSTPSAFKEPTRRLMFRMECLHRICRYFK